MAAALAYGAGGEADAATTLVFDVGGGTYDVSLLQNFDGIIEVLDITSICHPYSIFLSF